MMRALDRSSEVTVDESTHVGRLVRLAWVRHPRSVGCLARVTIVSLALLDGDRDVGREVWASRKFSRVVSFCIRTS